MYAQWIGSGFYVVMSQGSGVCAYGFAMLCRQFWILLVGLEYREHLCAAIRLGRQGQDDSLAPTDCSFCSEFRRRLVYSRIRTAGVSAFATATGP